ncbi:MAG: NAD(P)-dependent oxidoreductase [Synechococcus sp. MED-G71]|nr:MAG: NAD(P)-dependent oxidoreductase [Synechococcus sp. MED-G71]|tara:strand:+ start:13746 stop:14597 length:852 start_codon:yes stop_codon:yes gene_type:complete
MASIALLGTGLLGTAIAQRLLEQGHQLRVWNRTPAKTAGLVDAGASLIGALKGAARGCDTVITVLRDGPCSAEVIAELGELDGAVLMGMGTMGIGESRGLERQVQQQGGAYLEAPVLGSKPEALKGTLLVMAGGNEATFLRQQPLLADLSLEPRLMGPMGSGMASKLALNQLIASLTHGFSVALRLIQAADVPAKDFMEVLRPSAVYAPTYDKKLERMLSGHYSNPNFSTALLRKDLALFLRESESLGVNAAGLSSLLGLLDQANSALDELDYCAMHQLTAER